MAVYPKPKKPPATHLDIYACGGDVSTTRSQFLKQSDAFRHDTEKTNFKKVGKGGSMSKLAGDSKSRKPVKPQD